MLNGGGIKNIIWGVSLGRAGRPGGRNSNRFHKIFLEPYVTVWGNVSVEWTGGNKGRGEPFGARKHIWNSGVGEGGRRML